MHVKYHEPAEIEIGRERRWIAKALQVLIWILHCPKNSELLLVCMCKQIVLCGLKTTGKHNWTTTTTIWLKTYGGILSGWHLLVRELPPWYILKRLVNKWYLYDIVNM